MFSVRHENCGAGIALLPHFWTNHHFLKKLNRKRGWPVLQSRCGSPCKVRPYMMFGGQVSCRLRGHPCFRVVEVGFSAPFLLPAPPRKLPLRVRFPLGGPEVTWRDCYASDGVASAPAGESGGQAADGARERRRSGPSVEIMWRPTVKCRRLERTCRWARLHHWQGEGGSAVVNATRNGTAFLCSWAALPGRAALIGRRTTGCSVWIPAGRFHCSREREWSFE